MKNEMTNAINDSITASPKICDWAFHFFSPKICWIDIDLARSGACDVEKLMKFTAPMIINITISTDSILSTLSFMLGNMYDLDS